MRYVDLKYVQLLKSKLRNFKKKDTNLFNFSCPICGDSERDTRKARGYIYPVKNGLSYKCHNCDASMGFSYFLKNVSPVLHKEYSLEIFSNENKIWDDNQKKVVVPDRKPAFELNLPSISSLEMCHPAKRYILDRKIPEFAHSFLYYTDDFYAFSASVSEKYKERYSKELLIKEARIVIPFYNREGELICLQGRALTKTKPRYISLKVNDSTDLIYGLERINFGEPVYIVEGPLDSLFLPNCLAVAGSDLKRAINNFSDLGFATFIFDNEPRNSQICKKMGELIESGKKIVIWPKSIKEKDINDMCLSGISKIELIKIINKNSYSGIRANIEFSSWKKC